MERLSLADAVGRVHSVDTIGLPLGPGQPSAFIHALDARADWVDLTIAGALLVDLYGVFMKPGVRMLSGFFGPAERFLADSGANIEFVPADFRRLGPLLQERSPRIMATLAAPPDADGFCSLSLHAGGSIDELHRAGLDPDRLLVVETNAAAPRTFGLPPDHPHRLHVDEIDILVESDRPLFTIVDAEPSEEERQIAEFASSFVTDGCTLQTGIGGIPSRVVKLLAEGNGGDYGVHSEMFTTGLMHLHQAGKVSNARKGEFDGFSVTTFAAGTPELYTWLHDNDAVRFLPVHIVNSPDVIAKNRKFVSINGALAIDLRGQVMADSIDGKQFSGIGGHEDFVAPSGLQLEDRSLFCLRATSTRDGRLVSRIMATLGANSIVTTPRHQVDVVITEFGIAELRGRTVRERAAALTAVAHPDFRAELAQATES